MRTLPSQPHTFFRKINHSASWLEESSPRHDINAKMADRRPDRVPGADSAWDSTASHVGSTNPGSRLHETLHLLACGKQVALLTAKKGRSASSL